MVPEVLVLKERVVHLRQARWALGARSRTVARRDVHASTAAQLTRACSPAVDALVTQRALPHETGSAWPEPIDITVLTNRERAPRKYDDELEVALAAGGELGCSSCAGLALPAGPVGGAPGAVSRAPAPVSHAFDHHQASPRGFSARAFGRRLLRLTSGKDRRPGCVRLAVQHVTSQRLAAWVSRALTS
jgi:hypothetical protein